MFSGTSENETYDEKLIHPAALKISRLFPGKPRQYSTTPEIKTNKKSESKTIQPSEKNGIILNEENKSQNNIFKPRALTGNDLKTISYKKNNVE